MKLINCLFVVCIFLISGCSSVMPTRYAVRTDNRRWTPEYIENLNISTEPVGAKIYVNDGYVGISPLKVTLPQAPVNITQSGSYQVMWRDGDFGFTDHSRTAKRSSTTTWNGKLSTSIDKIVKYQITAFKEGYHPTTKLVHLSSSKESLEEAVRKVKPTNNGELPVIIMGNSNLLLILAPFGSHPYTSSEQTPQQTNTYGRTDSVECERAKQDYSQAEAAYNAAKSDRGSSRGGQALGALGSISGSPEAALWGLFAGVNRNEANDSQADMEHALRLMQDAKGRMSIHCGN